MVDALDPPLRPSWAAAPREGVPHDPLNHPWTRTPHLAPPPSSASAHPTTLQTPSSALAPGASSLHARPSPPYAAMFGATALDVQSLYEDSPGPSSRQDAPSFQHTEPHTPGQPPLGTTRAMQGVSDSRTLQAAHAHSSTDHPGGKGIVDTTQSPQKPGSHSAQAAGNPDQPVPHQRTGCYFWGCCGCCPSIVAITANAVAGAEAKCQEAGMNAFLAKPITLPELAFVLLKCLGEDV